MLSLATAEQKAGVKRWPVHCFQGREYRIMHQAETPKHVFIFVRIFNINAKDRCRPPKAAFYVDPWQMYTVGRIKVWPSKESYSVSFTGDPSFLVDHVQSSDGIMHGELSKVAGRQAGFCVREFRLE